MNAKKWFTLAAAGLVVSGAATVGTLDTSAQADGPGISVVRSELSKAGGNAVATCPSGSKAIGGGYQGAGKFNNPGTVSETIADIVAANGPTSDGTGWVARFQKGRVAASALCKSGVSTQVVRSELSTAGGAAVATCPSGSKAIGGGYQGLGKFNNPGTVSETIADIVAANGPTSDGTGWVARLQKGRVAASVLCAS